MALAGRSLKAVLLVLFVAVASPAAVRAADSGASPPASLPRVAAAAPETPPAPATLRFFNRDIFTFRVPFVGHSPAGRAAIGNERIRQALAQGGAGTVRVVRTEQWVEILIDGIHIFRILEGDLDANDGQTFEEAAVVVTRRLNEAIAAYRQSGPSREMLREFAAAALATLVLIVAIWFLRMIRVLARRRIDTHLARRLHLG